MNEDKLTFSGQLSYQQEINDSILTLHEAILDENVDDIRTVIREWQSSGLSVKELVHKEIELEPAEGDHHLNQLPLSAVHRAAISHSESCLSLLMNCHDDVNPNLTLSCNGFTPLHISALAGSTATASYLASNGACVTLRDKHGQTALHLSARHRQTDLSKVLVVRGSPVDATDDAGETPLHLAAEAGSKEAVMFLLGRQAKVNAVDQRGQTPLHKAASRGHVDVLLLLITKGASVNIVDCLGHSPLHSAICCTRKVQVKTDAEDWLQTDCADESRCLSCVHILIEHKADINLMAHDGTTPLCLATENGQMSLVKELIDCGASVNKVDKSASSAIFLAHSLEIMVFLIENGAFVNQRNTDTGNTVLHAFAADENIPLEMVTELIRRSADVNAVNILGETPAFVSCKTGNYDKTVALLTAGSSINSVSNNGQTLLHAALWSKNPELIVHFIQNSDMLIDVQDMHSMTPLDVAVETGDLESVKLLTEKLTKRGQTGMGGMSPGNRALKLQKYDIFRELLHQGWSFEERKEQTSPLLVYTDAGDLEMCKILCSMTDGVNEKDANGQTSLHLAVARGATDVIKFLLESGAEVNSVDMFGCSALHIACKQSPPSADDISLLIKYGADVNSQNNSGQTALHMCFGQRPTKTDIAAWNNVVNLFVCSGSSLNLIDSDKDSALLLLIQLAIETDCDVIKRYCNVMLSKFIGEEKVDPNISNSSGKTLMMFSAQISSGRDLAQKLIAKGAVIDSVDCNGLTALHYACRHANTSFVSLLIKNGCKLNILDLEGHSELYYCIRSKCSDALDELINSGSDVNIRDNFGQSLLHHALISRTDDICESLIDLIDDVNCQDQDGNIPLHKAASLSTSSIVRLLLSCDALVNQRNKDGQTPLLSSVSNLDLGVMKALIVANAEIDACDDIHQNTALHLSSREGHYDQVNLLVTSRANIDAVNANGDTPLHMAASNRDSDIIELLIANEASIDLQNKQGHTPLALALKSANIDGIRAMLDQQPDVNLRDSNGDTLLHHCVSMFKLNKTLIKRLVSLGCSGNIRNYAGNTPCDVLLLRKDVSIADDLIELLQCKHLNV